MVAVFAPPYPYVGATWFCLVFFENLLVLASDQMKVCDLE